MENVNKSTNITKHISGGDVVAELLFYRFVLMFGNRDFFKTIILIDEHNIHQRLIQALGGSYYTISNCSELDNIKYISASKLVGVNLDVLSENEQAQALTILKDQISNSNDKKVYTSKDILSDIRCEISLIHNSDMVHNLILHVQQRQKENEMQSVSSLEELIRSGGNLHIEKCRYGDVLLFGIDVCCDNHTNPSIVEDLIDVACSPGDTAAMQAIDLLDDFAHTNDAFLYVVSDSLSEGLQKLNQRAFNYQQLDKKSKTDLWEVFVKTIPECWANEWHISYYNEQNEIKSLLNNK